MDNLIEGRKQNQTQHGLVPFVFVFFHRHSPYKKNNNVRKPVSNLKSVKNIAMKINIFSRKSIPLPAFKAVA